MAFTTTIGTENLLKTATVVASSDSTNAPNLWDSMLTDFWSPATGAQTLTIDHGADGFIQTDTFTDTDGTLLSAHTSDFGVTWVQSTRTGTKYTPSIQDNKIQLIDNTTMMSYFLNEAATKTDQYVQATISTNSASSNTNRVLLYARSDLDVYNCYYIIIDFFNNSIALNKTVLGVTSTLSTYPITLSDNTDYTVKIECIGTAIKGYLNGSNILSVTDSSVTTAGYVGMYGYIAAQGGQRTYVDDFQADYGSSIYAIPIDYIGIAGHNLGTDGAEVAVEWSDDDITYSPIITIRPADDLVIFKQFTSVSHRYTKITVTGTAAKIASINIGATVDLSGTLNSPFTEPKDSGDYMFNTSMTEGGLPTGRSVKHIKYEFTMSFRNVLPSWITSTWPAIYEAIRNEPFYLLWDATNHPNDAVYAWLTDDSKPAYAGITYKQYSLKCGCVL